MEKRLSVNPDTMLLEPFVVFKVNSAPAYQGSLEICSYLLIQCKVKCIYVEDLNCINIDKIISETNSIEEAFLLKKGYEEYSRKIIKFDLETQTSDLCIVIGGDGTTLWASSLYNQKTRPPFLTFHLGLLGYIAIYNFDEYEDVLKELYSDNKNLSYERRSLVTCQVYEKVQQPGSYLTENVLKWETTALNEILIDRGEELKMVGLQIYMNEEPLTEVMSDGLICATATGSTAYCLSAGGTIVHYDVDTLILNSVSPHSLSWRPINFPRNIKLKIVPSQCSEGKVAVTNDGISRAHLGKNQFMEIKLSDSKADFILLNKYEDKRSALWVDKVVQQLGWNNAFKYY